MQLKEKPELNQINQESEFWAKTYQPYRPIKERKSVAKNYQPDLRPIKERESITTTLLKIIFIYFPLGLIFFVFIIFPAFFMCNANKAKQSEGKQFVSSINKGQQAYYAENSKFSNSVNALSLGLKTQTTNYNYSISATKNAAFSYAIPLKETKNLSSYVGAVSLVLAGEAKTTASILCQANSPGNTQLPNPIVENGDLVCAPGTNRVTK